MGNSPSVSTNFSGDHRNNSISRSPSPSQMNQNRVQYNSRSPSPQLIFKPQQNSKMFNNTVKPHSNTMSNNHMNNNQMLRKLPPVPGLMRSTTLQETSDNDENLELGFIPNNQQQGQNISYYQQQQQQQRIKKMPNVPNVQSRQTNIRHLPNSNPSQSLQRQANTIVSFPNDTVKLVTNRNNRLKSSVDLDESENWF